MMLYHWLCNVISIAEQCLALFSQCAAIGDIIYDQIKATDVDAGLAGTLSASCYQRVGNTKVGSFCSSIVQRHISVIKTTTAKNGKNTKTVRM